jgi:hypothetical protein
MIEFRELRPWQPLIRVSAALYYCPYVPLMVMQGEHEAALRKATQITFKTRYDATAT